MKISSDILDDLTSQAKSSDRLRMSLDLRTSNADQSQRILNAVEPGTQVPIHRHRTSTETVIVIRGRLVESFYNDIGEVTNEILLEVGGDCSMLQIPAGQWHGIKALESGTIIFEAKDGAYKPISKEDILHINS